MHDFTPNSALIGGGIIGLAASLFLFAHGRICGISGLFAGVLRGAADIRGLRSSFIAGMIATGFILRWITPGVFATSFHPPSWVVAAAGLLVGFGTQLGNGCTSGHGICGLSRLSRRSLVATGTFMVSGFAAVFVVKHMMGVLP